MAKAKSKVKFDFKDFLLKKGEYLAMGIAGFFLVVLTLWGITKWSGAKDPDATSKTLVQKATGVQSQITTSNVTEEDKEAAKPPPWVLAKYEFKRPRVEEFAIMTPLFDPVANPDTRKENPHVLAINAYQVDLTKGGMPAVDKILGPDGEELIAVIYNKKIDPNDSKQAQALKNIMKQGRKGKKKAAVPKKEATPQPPGGFQPPPGGFQPPPGGMGGMGPGPGFGAAGYNPYGGLESFNYGGQRTEKAIEYIPVSQLDAALKKQKGPAKTIVPVRMISVHAEIPLKRQIEELRRALRLPSTAEAARWGPVYDGYEVKRKISVVTPEGKLEVLQDWAEYDFESEYRDRINSLRVADRFDEGYLGYFVRYEMSLALPFPDLVPETGVKYPDVRLKNIQETIKKLEAANKEKVEASELVKRVSKGTARGDLYKPMGSGQTGGWILGETGIAGMGPMEPGPGAALPPGALTGGMPPRGGMFNPLEKPPVATEVDHLLLRYIDSAVEPGQTYEYQIRLRMRNPNYKRTNEVSKPSDAEREVLYSPWVQTEPITVPSESYLYAADWGEYTRKINEEHEKEQALKQRLQAKEHQAVVETVTWMEQVKTGDGGKREPVGAWVVADYPVGRGEYIGRKTYVKLPLWSSENAQYILREVPDRVIPKVGVKDPPQPRGWLMDFTSNKSILVDFEGGKVRTKVGTRDHQDEVATEMLVLRGDGKLIVKRSTDAAQDEERKKVVSGWDKWVKEVATRKASTTEDTGGFSPRPPGQP